LLFDAGAKRKPLYDGLDAQNVIARPKGPWQSQFIVFEIASLLAPKGQAPRNDKEGCLKYNIREMRYEISAKISDFW
jgi:hypothetical protein